MKTPCTPPSRWRLTRHWTPDRALAVALGLSLLLVCLPVAAQSMPFVPPSYTAEYEAQKMGLSVVGHITLTREGEFLRYRARLRPTGVLSWVRSDEIIEQSIMRMTPDGLRSEEYLYSHTGGSRKRLTESRFDWEAYRVKGVHNDKPFELDLPPDAVDRFALQLAMINRLHRGEKEFSQTIVDRDRIRTYHFTVGEPRNITTPMGRVEAIPVIREIEDRDTTVSTWFAPRMNYLPVRLEQEQNGDSVVLNIRSLEWHDNPR
ncbi:DUF3108 domain-containing protein [Ectothiorhodospira sp. BSL-9]|uniref:DUF3108 domain-containing protein n=1 Tax=Ectothiorhodospira sp. BSL-9 TaxID=1442136 RepID=UPI0007B45585|nr:DUF3108 domain-containing protein [Ectothiorhodospira sp. BSL-9]ANB02415.1 hypothetical protein ECTOBSL9_1802 [Ectothiorhodospira sp. BSL-9]